MDTRIFMVTLFCLCNCSAGAQHSVLWGNLKEGQYNTGYKTVWVFDFSRTWDDRPRPIRMNVWYPAQKGGQSMLFEEYVFPKPPDNGFSVYAEKLRQRDVGDSSKSLKGLFKGNEKLYTQLLKLPVHAVENAAEATGKFPIVVYSLGQDDYSQENTVLCEYLASHGFIIISVPQVGISSRKTELMIDEELSFEAQVRDLEFAISLAYSLPNANVTKIASMGMSMGGVYSLLTAMRNKSIRLVIGLDPSYMWPYESYGYKYWEAKYYDEWNLRIPIVSIFRDDKENNFDIINKLKFSKRHLIKFPQLIHSDFTSYPMFTSLASPIELDEYALQHRNQATAAHGYSSICNIVLNALERYINDDSAIIITSANDKFKNAIKAPNEERFCEIIQKKGIEAALKLFEEAAKEYPGDTLVREKIIRRIGFEYYLSGDIKQAIGVYTLYTKAYPLSSDAFESLGEMFLYDKNREKAKINIEKSLKLNPENTDAKKMLDKLNN